VICLLIGTAFSRHGAGFILPNKYADDDRWLSHINLSFSRLVLCLQVFLTGLQLPPKYLRQQWRPLLIVLGPGMTLMWLISSLIVWALTKNFSFLESLVVGGCIAPTDPVLANSIIKGRFADDYMPLDLTHFIAAESGANDGLAYPFVFLGLWLFYARHSADVSTSTATGYWFGDTWAYVVLLSVVWGTITGYVARKVLRFFANLRYIDLESFHAFPVFTALMLIGTCGLVGSDDVLACFVAGNVMGWTGWFQSETDDDSSQSTLDMLLTQAIFLWFGAVCPWPEFADSAEVIGIGRLIALAVLVLLLRRLPVILSMYKIMGPVPNLKFAAVMGHFGPVGVSAIFYLYETVIWLEEHFEPSPEVSRLERVTRLVVWFVVVSCVVSHLLKGIFEINATDTDPNRSYMDLRSLPSRFMNI